MSKSGNTTQKLINLAYEKLGDDFLKRDDLPLSVELTYDDLQRSGLTLHELQTHDIVLNIEHHADTREIDVGALVDAINLSWRPAAAHALSA